MTVPPLSMARLELGVGDRQRIFLPNAEVGATDVSDSRIARDIGNSLLLPNIEETDAPQAAPVAQESRSSRHSRRPTSYFNAFQSTCAVSNDAPPSYATAVKATPRTSAQDLARERLPRYTCTVSFEKKVLLNFELTDSTDAGWREVYMVIRGTIINFHRVKDGRAGPLLYTYTLQHAEVGLAADVEYAILVPQSRFARLIPTAARRRAFQKDPDLFEPVPQTILRLRAEIDQLLIADSSEEDIYSIVHTIGAAIDIAQPIDDRSIPRPCTVPRRRRRQRTAATTTDSDLTDPAVIAEQERLIRTMYPGLAAEAIPVRVPELINPSPLASPTREEEEFDLSMIREDLPSPSTQPPSTTTTPTIRPTANRQTTATTIGSTFSDIILYESDATNFDADSGKWHPPQLRSAQQIQRYIRRCMPILLAESPRASEICIYAGQRVRINPRTDVLEEWTLAPPSYKAHNFQPALSGASSSDLSRSISQTSATTTTAHGNRSVEALTSTTTLDPNDLITPVEELHLTLTSSGKDGLQSGGEGGDKRDSTTTTTTTTQRKSDSMTSAHTTEDGKTMVLVHARERNPVVAVAGEDAPVVLCF